MNDARIDAPPKVDSREALVLAEFLPYRIVALGHRISRDLSRVYEGEDLTIPEWRVLAVIAQVESMAARDVAAMTPMDKMAVSRAVGLLERKGLLVRKSAADRRVFRLALSEAGRAIYRRVAGLAAAFERRLLSALGTEERRAFEAALLMLESNVDVQSGDQ